jgi:hypothetical protein
MSDRRTTAGAYAKIEAHEDLCAERYRAINETLGELREAAGKQSALLWGIVLSVAGSALLFLVGIVLHALQLA